MTTPLRLDLIAEEIKKERPILNYRIFDGLWDHGYIAGYDNEFAVTRTAKQYWNRNCTFLLFVLEAENYWK